MSSSLDREKINQCLLMLIGSLQVLDNLGDLETEDARDYRRNLQGFFDYTMATLERMPDRAPLRVVD